MTQRQNEFALSIAEVLAEFDIMDLREGNPDILDEYRPEAEDIAMRLQKILQKGESISLSEIPEMLSGVFEYWFEEKFTASELEALARRIYGLLPKDG